MISIFGFGCWNKLSCQGNPHLINVVESLSSRKDLDFGFILGDSVYSNDDSKDSKQNMLTINCGLDIINRINLQKYGVLGNHDVYCNKQKSYLLNSQKIILFEYNNSFYSFIRNTNGILIKVIVIDTNTYKDYNLKKEKCNESDIDESVTFNFEEHMKNQKEFISKELEDIVNYDHIIIAGHEPLASSKTSNKLKKSKNMDEENKSLFIKNEHLEIDFLNFLCETMYKRFQKYKTNFIYFCADAHIFQHNIITYKGEMIINCIISGTGGADPDVIPFEENIKFNIIEEISVKIIKSEPAFGYTVLKINKTKFEVEYCKVEDFTSVKNKYKQIKNIYIRIKNRW